jgi:AraC-like DNA-binding protein
LLNEYRIKEACRRLNDTEHYGNITINGIASSVGFKTRTNFIAYFKRFTGLTPSEYLKIANSKKNTNK